ncbi:MAG: hypothetical protein Ta2F_11750 [Termitinemataceae bacterium]|nr:MAG: hypothetical protein Ta2F_11750 [Termitinemataceae bacterium]
MSEYNQVFYPESLQDMYSIWNRYPLCTIFSGGASLLQTQRTIKFKMPEAILSLDNIDELHNIDRRERYIDIGSQVTLNRILKLGKIIPDFLKDTIQYAATSKIRNLISLGSAICQRTDAITISAAMAALNARYELRTANQSRWLTALTFAKSGKDTVFEKQELLYRIRIPLQQWNYSLCRALKAPAGTSDPRTESGFAIFLASMEKDIISSVCIVLASSKIIIDKNIESKLVGKKLPLDIREADSFVQVWKNYLDTFEESSAFLRSRFLNFIESAIMHFVD